MQRSRDWRREQFKKRRRRDHSLANSMFPPSGCGSRDERIADNYESIKKGGFRFSWIAQWLDDDWIIEGKIRNKNKNNLPLDKELEAWYNDEEPDEDDEFLLRELGMID